MIRLALRLAVAGGKEAAARLAVIVAAVAIGVGLLLITLAGINAVHAQNDRYAWLETGSAPAAPSDRVVSDPLLWRLTGDQFDGKTIARVDVAATGPGAPVPPGIPRLPGPGEFYASPTLATLLRSTPAAELGARYGGHQIGTIGPAALPAPNSLIIVVGHTVADLSRPPGAARITSITTTPPNECSNCPIGVGINANGLALILGVVAAGLLVPVLIFIGTATRLSAARREQRFAAMRLVGATPRQVSLISAVESSVATVAGVALGFALFLLLRPAVAGFAFTGAPFFVSDLSLNLADVLCVVIGVPLAAALAARLALRRVQISPLGVSRHITPKAPRAYRLVPLAAGLAELAYFAVEGNPATTAGQVRAYLPGFVLILVGLVVAGPWLTMAGARLLARRAAHPATLVAGRRLSDDPQAGFRAVSGLVLALFVTSVAIGCITTVVAYNDRPDTGSGARSTLLNHFLGGPDDSRPPTIIPSADGGVPTKLRAINGVRGVAIIHLPSTGKVPIIGVPDGLVSCDQLARTPAIGRCATGAQTASIAVDFGDPVGQRSTAAQHVWPAAASSPQQLNRLPVATLVVATDGSRAAIESARTVLERAYPALFPAETMGELNADNARLLTEYQQLANVIILTSLPIAGCSLAVSVAAGLNDRKRPFSLLRLTGAPLGMLRRVVALETAVPLLVTAVVSAGTGFLAAHLFLTSQLDETLQPPGVQYYVIVAAGLVAALAVIGSTLPLLERLTGPETARNE